MLGRGLGEIGETVAAAEVDREELGRIDVFAADWAFLVEGDLLHFRFLCFLLFFGLWRFLFLFRFFYFLFLRFLCFLLLFGLWRFLFLFRFFYFLLLPFLGFLFLFLFFLFLRFNLGELEAEVDVHVGQRLLQLGRALLGDAALPRVNLAQEFHVLEACQTGVGHLGVVEVERHQVGESLDLFQRRVVDGCVGEAELREVFVPLDMPQTGSGDLCVGEVEFAQVLNVGQRSEVVIVDVLADKTEVGVNQLGVLCQRHHQRGTVLLPDALSGTQLGNGRLLGIGNGSLLDFRLRQFVGGGLGGGAILGADQH